MTDLIRLDRDGPVGILRFIQPKKRNPYSIAFVEELVAYLRDAERDDAIRAVVMTGGEHFSSGGILSASRPRSPRGPGQHPKWSTRFTTAVAPLISFANR